MEEVGKILPKVLQPQFSRLEPPVIEVLAPLWTQVAGKALARECRPVEFNSGILTLATHDPDWIESLKQLAEEIRAHVNSFLGKPVVKHLRILSACKLNHAGRALGPQERLHLSEPSRRDWPGRRPGVASTLPETIGRSHVKYIIRKRGKVL